MRYPSPQRLNPYRGLPAEGRAKPMVWGAVNAGYHVVGTIVAAIIVASWQSRGG